MWPIGPSLPLGVFALVPSGLLLVGLQLQWFAPTDAKTVAYLLLGFAVPLQFASTVLAFLGRALAADTDPCGIPVARFDYTLSDNDEANMTYSTNVIKEVLQAAGAQDVLTIQRYAHLVGGGRMVARPDNSVVDSDHRVWGVPNLFRCDGSVCPTQGSPNPALTIMALASRLAQRLATGRVDPVRAAVGATA